MTGPPRVSWGAVDLLAFVGIYLAVGLPAMAGVLGVGPLDAWGRPTTTARVVYAISEVGAVGLILLILRVRRGGIAELGWRGASSDWLLAALPLAAAGSVLVYVLSAISRALGIPGAVQCEGLRQALGGGVGTIALGVAVVCVVAPFAEETFYRGFVFGWLRTRLPLPLAAVTSAAVFGLAHHDAGLFLPLTGLGVVLAAVYQRSGSLWPGMLAHGTFNAAGMLSTLHSGC